MAAKAATTTIPIVFGTGGDPVKLGLVASLNRPGGNTTGISFLTSDLGAKQLELLREVVPNAALIAVLMNPTNPVTESLNRSFHDGAARLGVRVVVLNAVSESDIEIALSRRSFNSEPKRHWSPATRSSLSDSINSSRW
jgi:putative ABC transport system substrate-binding protein